MELNRYTLERTLRDNPNQVVNVWACCFNKREAAKRTLRNQPPILLTVRYETGTFGGNLMYRDHAGKTVKFDGNAHGDELKLYEMYDECVAYYNGQLDYHIATMQKGIEKIQGFIAKCKQSKII